MVTTAAAAATAGVTEQQEHMHVVRELLLMLSAVTNLALGAAGVRLVWGTGPTAFKNMPARNGRIIPGSLLMNPIRQSLEEGRTLAPYNP